MFHSLVSFFEKESAVAFGSCSFMYEFFLAGNEWFKIADEAFLNYIKTFLLLICIKKFVHSYKTSHLFVFKYT